MKILEYVTIKGRGVVAVVDAMPPELKLGTYVRGTILNPGNWRWRVCGIETHAIPRTREMTGGLLLKGDDPLPAVGEELEVCP